MSLKHSPAIVMNGLTLYCDMFNLKKSWRGAPTTNQYANCNAFSLWSTKAGMASIVDNAAFAPDGTFTASLLTTLGTTNSYVANGGTVVSGNTYTRSIYAKAGTTGTLVFECYDNNGSGGNGYFTTFFDVSAGTIVSSATGNIASIEACPDGWYRCIVTRAYTKDYSTCGTFYVGAYGNGVGNIYLWGAQFEAGAMATQLVITGASSASRSNTTALLDMTGLNTLDLVSLTYNSDNTFSFNGTSNYINCGNNVSVQHASAITMAAWVKPVSSTGLGNIMSKNMNSGYRFRIANGQLWWYVSGNSVTGGSCPNGAWAYCVVTGDSSGLKAYVNGELVVSNAVAYAPTSAVTNNLYIGCDYATHEHFNGTIATAAIYNRALTAAEVKQNFNATRGRFGL